jgi:DNA-binding CsgD family transcriptional regulator
MRAMLCVADRLLDARSQRALWMTVLRDTLRVLPVDTAARVVASLEVRSRLVTRLRAASPWLIARREGLPDRRLPRLAFVGQILARGIPRRELVVMLEPEAPPESAPLAAELLSLMPIPGERGAGRFSAMLCRGIRAGILPSLNGDARLSRTVAPFSEREERVLHLLHAHALWTSDRLPAAVAPPVNGSRLSPRQNQTLAAVLDGLSEKQIASRLGRSHNTVHTHMRGIYRAFGVNSRAELLARFVRRA